MCPSPLTRAALFALALAGCAHGASTPPIAEVEVPPAPAVATGEAPSEKRDPPERPVARREPRGDLAPLIVRIVHTARREQDARTIADRLRDLGAQVRLYPTSDDLNEAHVGHLYVRKSVEKYASIIVQAVADVEDEQIVEDNGLEGDHNAVLWIVR